LPCRSLLGAGGLDLAPRPVDPHEQRRHLLLQRRALGLGRSDLREQRVELRLLLLDLRGRIGPGSRGPERRP